MKRLLYILSFVMLLGFVGCTPEKIVNLDNTSGDRVDKLIRGYKNTLVSAEFGWIAYINTSEGFYRFWMEFSEEGRVVMLTDNPRVLNGDLRADESSYAIRQFQRPTLTFQTYSYLAMMNDPVDEISGGQDHQGLVTDFEFEIAGYKDGVFTMQGRINRVDALLIEATESQKNAIDATNLLTSEIKDVGLYGGGKDRFFYIDNDGDEIGLLLKPRSITAIYEDESGANYIAADPCLEVESKNFFFFKPMDINGFVIDEMRWSESNQRYTAISKGNEYEVFETDKAPIELHKIFGYRKPFNQLFLPKMTRNGQNFGIDPSEFANFEYTFNSPNAVQSVVIYFDKTLDTGKPILVVKINPLLKTTTGGYAIFPVTYVFFLENQGTEDAPVYIDDSGKFKLEDRVSYEEDNYGIIEDLLSYEGGDLYTPTLGGFEKSFRGQTFKINWSSADLPEDYLDETGMEFYNESGGKTRRGIMKK